MSTLQIVFLVLGIVLVLSAVWKPVYDTVKKLLNRKSVNVDKKDEDLKIDIGPQPTEDSFADIVREWEDFTNVLVRNKMRECAEDMKTLLIKMSREYRQDLNEDDESGIDNILR